jgi:FAD:protein FMN transferase
MRFSCFCLLVFFFYFRPGVFKKYTLTGLAQGTTYAVTYYAFDSLVSKKQVDSVLNSLDSSLSLYKPYSFINSFNNSDKGKLINKHFKNVLLKSLLIYKETNGLFDITVQPLVQAWGFGVSKTDSLPSKEKIDSLIRCVGMSDIKLRGNYIEKKMPCVKIDMNGIAQGYSVDIIAEYLESKGIKDYLVELGGEIRVNGRKQPSGEKMKIGIESPDADEFGDSSLQKTVLIEKGALTTSGSYRNYYESNGKRITHIIDPKTGYPVQNELISVTVYAKDAITSDAYDNAIMLMGLKKGMKFIEKRKDLAAYFIYKKKDGKIADTASSRFRNLFSN